LFLIPVNTGAPQPASAAAYVTAIGVLFFLSGISGLVYQVLWLRLLSLVFGVTVYAASAVLASFMAGLGVGSIAGGWLAAERADRCSSSAWLNCLLVSRR
jgi:spermidine synthase